MKVEREVDYILVPAGLGVMGLYHAWLIYTILCYPRRTVIGLNAETRHQWVFSIMSDPLKNGTLAVQTIRNNIMASTLLATAAITLSSLISLFVSSASDSSSTASKLVYGNKTSTLSSVKYFAILLCFLVAFLCNVQSIRYYAHVSFMATVPTFKDSKESIEYVARNLNRGSLFWSLGLRAFYFSFPLFLWIFGPIPMFSCCCIMSFVLYFLDTTTSFTRTVRQTRVGGERRRTSGHADPGKSYEGNAVVDRSDSGNKRKRELDNTSTSLVATEGSVGVGFPNGGVHDGDSAVSAVTLPSLQGGPMDTNVYADACGDAVQHIKNEECEMLNGGSSTSRDAEKLAIEKMMSGQYSSHQTLPDELEELEDGILDSKISMENLGGSSKGGIVESSTANEAVLLTTSNKTGTSIFQLNGSLEEIEATELTAPLSMRIHSTSAIQPKPVMRVSFTSLAKATGKRT